MRYTRVTDNKEIIQIISDTFKGDVNQRKHFVSKTEEEGIRDTYEKNIVACENVGAEMYRLSDGKNNLLGFITVIKPNVLLSFGLKYEERTEGNKKKFIETVEKLLPVGDIVCALYSKNERGIRFLQHHGFEVEQAVTLIKRR